MKPIRAFSVLAVLGFLVGCSSSSQSETVQPERSSSSSEVIIVSPQLPETNSPQQPEKAPATASHKSQRLAKFAELDVNHDGQLSAAEFGTGRSSKSGDKWFGRRDADHNGFLSPAEFLPQSPPSGKQGDTKQSDTDPLADKASKP